MITSGRRRTKVVAKQRKLELIQFLGGKCVDCGYTGHHAAFDFDHIIPSTKTYRVGKMLENRRWDLILAEVRKCELRCANCHRIKTYLERQS